MKFRTVMLALVLVVAAVSLTFGVTIIDNYGFPYKGLVMGTKTFQGMNLNRDDFVTVKNSLYTWEFTVQGKKYKADLLSFGAIYMTREGQNPVVISFNTTDFRYKYIHLIIE